jgi:hypothetical protein
MLQRVQTIYLILSILCLGIAATTEIGIYTFKEGKNSVSAIVSGKGVHFIAEVDGEKKDVTNEVVEIEERNPNLGETNLKDDLALPLYIPFVLLICWNIWTIISYKKLKKQLGLARIGTFLSLLITIGVIVGFSIGKTIGAKMLGLENIADDLEITTGMGIGFFTAVACLPFAFLTQIAIKRDLKLIQSIDRIR